MKIDGKQPLGYQQQDSSCWITSVMNGMICLLGSASRIPNEIARIIYALSSKDGTELKEARKVADFLNFYAIDLQCSLLERDQVTPGELRKVLARGVVVVADVRAGAHSVLVTGYHEGKYQIFDPNWDVIKAGLRSKVSNAEFSEPTHRYNVLVPEEEFFAGKVTDTGKLRMGAVSKRCLFIMEPK